MSQSYAYVGPAELLELAGRAQPGSKIPTRADFLSWLDEQEIGSEVPELVVATFVVDLRGILRLSPRRNEHVVCAGGERVLGAGELAAYADGSLGFITNQSTGYCPPVSCWPAVAAALEAVGIAHLSAFTTEFTFRRCPGCGERNLVKEAWFVCALCEAELPEVWNFGDVL